MQVGISTASLFMRRNNEEALPLLDRLGVQTAEVFLTSLSEYGEDFARILKERKGGVFVNSVHILNSQIEPQLFSGHERVKGDSFALLDKVLSGAKLLGAPHYTFHGMARYKKSSRDPKNDNFEKIGLGLREISDFCQKYDIKLCLENVEWSTYNRVGVFSAMKSYVPNLLGVLDVKQARIAGEGYEKYVDEMGESLAYAHISDVDESGKICLPGQGVFDFDTLVKQLQDVGFDGALLIEVYKNDYSEITQLKTACDHVNEILYKNGCLK
jgi:sugar phosphate isomerase/epimerase